MADEPEEREPQSEDTVRFPDSPESSPEPGAPRSRRLRRTGLIATAVFALLAVLYGVDLAASPGEVPRGVTVAGVDIGGLDPATAEQRMREQIGPRLNRPITLRAGDVTTTLDPQAAGLTLNWSATLEKAGDQPLNPWTRLMSLFTTREVDVATEADRAALTSAVQGLQPKVDRPPREGGIRFQNTDPVPIEPRPGQRLDVPGAVDAILANWATGQPVDVPVRPVPVSTTLEGVQQAIDEVAEPAVSGPVTVTGEGGAAAVLEPAVIADALRFEPDGQGGLTARIETKVAIDALAPQLAETETQVRNAEVAVSGGSVNVVPSVNGHTVDWAKTLDGLMEVLTGDGDRTIPAVYVDQPAEFTTAEASTLENAEVISSFTTGGFAPDSGVNIRRVAEEVDGAVVAPGETFSLNGYTGHRGAAQGYIEAGIIKNGRPAQGIGGGISQFATTLFNAAYFAGMTNIEHHEHSYYISRYPEGREATVFEGVLDLVFRNDGPTPVLIQTSWTPESITVKFLGTKHYEVGSQTSGRSNFTEPGVKHISGEPCIETSGKHGFTVSNTRIVRDAQTGEVIKRNGHTTVYEPLPRVICTGSAS